MKKIEVIVNGKAFPCRTTMGAMLRFKRETGKEVVDITDWAFTDLCTFLWCCVASASKADGKKFDLSLMDFADNITPDELEAWAQSIKAEQETENKDTTKANGEKKSLA